jgi:predicted translin family RNA/ssDNA-binding protein
MSNETVTYSLEAVLKEIKDSIKEVSQKFDKIDERLQKLEICYSGLESIFFKQYLIVNPQQDYNPPNPRS